MGNNICCSCHENIYLKIRKNVNIIYNNIRVADPDPDPVGSGMFCPDPDPTNMKTNF